MNFYEIEIVTINVIVVIQTYDDRKSQGGDIQTVFYPEIYCFHLPIDTSYDTFGSKLHFLQ